VNRLLSGTGQIPIERGAGDAGALERALSVLRSGEALCVFPEGKLSRGERLRARSGVGRLATTCPTRA
jgi:1-acyl-sn-glycerol-3-phosphate acyltransferase